MTNIESAKERDEEVVGELLSLENNRFEVWKYFEERADRLGEQLWSTGTWLMSILAATLSLPFVAAFVKFPDNTLSIQITARIPVALIAAFGIVFCLYSYVALRDLRHHIGSNWRRANYARTGEWKPVTWDRGKRYGWKLLLGVGIFAFIAFVLLLIASCIS